MFICYYAFLIVLRTFYEKLLGKKWIFSLIFGNIFENIPKNSWISLNVFIFFFIFEKIFFCHKKGGTNVYMLLCFFDCTENFLRKTIRKKVNIFTYFRKYIRKYSEKFLDCFQSFHIFLYFWKNILFLLFFGNENQWNSFCILLWFFECTENFLRNIVSKQSEYFHLFSEIYSKIFRKILVFFSMFSYFSLFLKKYFIFIFLCHGND